MTTPAQRLQVPPGTTDGQIAVVICADAFRFAPGHELGASGCLICSNDIGEEPVTVLGVAALTGRPCGCGQVVSDVFLVHADHFPLPPGELQAAITRGLQCPDEQTHHH